jgi:FG-GAP repeat
VAACAAIALALFAARPPDQRAAAAHTSISHGLATLPVAAQGPVSAALGSEMPAYRVVGLAARNPAQGFDGRFSSAGVAVVSGRARVGISLSAFGRLGAVRSVPLVTPRVDQNRVSYSRGSLVEWWANGPLGLEQGFDVAAPPRGGTGPVTVWLALSSGVSARLDHRAVTLSVRGRSLAYSGLVVTDARGRTVRSWLGVDGGRVVVQVDDRGATYPLRVDPVRTHGATATLKIPHQATAGTCGAAGELGAGYDFGSSLAMSGDTIVGTTGAYGDDNHEYPGEVCVFTKPASGWSGTITQATTLIASDGRGPDLFGSGSGGAAAVSGGTVVVGAPNHRGRHAYGEAYVWAAPLNPASAASRTSGGRTARR